MAPKRKPNNKLNSTRKNGKRPAPIQQPRVVYPTNNGSRTHRVRFNNLVVANNGNAAIISNDTKRVGNRKAVFSTGKPYAQLHPFFERESGFPYLSVHENAQVSNSATLNKHGREELQTPIQLTNPQHFIELQHILGRQLTHN